MIIASVQLQSVRSVQGAVPTPPPPLHPPLYTSPPRNTNGNVTINIARLPGRRGRNEQRDGKLCETCSEAAAGGGINN